MSYKIVTNKNEYKDIMESLLDGGIVMVHLVPNRLGVKVPDQFKKLPILRLNFSYRYGIPDFCVDDRGVRASLSFGGVNYFCDIPWVAVVALSSQVFDEKIIFPIGFDIDQLVNVVSPMEAVQIMRDINSQTLLSNDEDDDDYEETMESLSPSEAFKFKEDLGKTSKPDSKFEDEPLKNTEDSDENSDDDEETDDLDESNAHDDDDNDDVPPGGWGPLRLV